MSLPWELTRGRWAERQRYWRSADAEVIRAHRSRLDALLRDPHRNATAAESFRARTQVEQAGRVCRMASELLRTRHAELNVVTATEQITIASADGVLASRPREAGWCENVVAEGSLAVHDGSRHPMVAHTEAAHAGQVVCYLGAQVVVAGQPVGALCVYDNGPRDWSPADAHRLGELAQVISDSTPRGPR